jgi:hypothetical protein
MPEKNNLSGEGLISAHDFRGFSPSSQSRSAHTMIARKQRERISVKGFFPLFCCIPFGPLAMGMVPPSFKAGLPHLS